jgi:hypothetical protein
MSSVEILNYALTLEHLEDKFYREGLANYTQADFISAGFPDPFYKNLKEVSVDETSHVKFLTAALGDAAVAECTYSFPTTNAKSFVGLAQVLVRLTRSLMLELSLQSYRRTSECQPTLEPRPTLKIKTTSLMLALS